MQEPKQKVSPEAVPPKVKMTNGGREQGDVPSLLIVGNYDWNMAKSYVKKAQLLLSFLSLNKVPSAPESDIISKQQIIKGERSANGYRSYWLLENGEVKKSIVALTDAEADELMNDNG